MVSAPKKPKRRGRELQLPSMSLLTSKMSDQQFFLRMLKVVIQLREAARKSAEKEKEAKKSESQEGASSQAASATSSRTSAPGSQSSSATLRNEETMEVDAHASKLNVKTEAGASASAPKDDALPRLSDHLSLGNNRTRCCTCNSRL